MDALAQRCSVPRKRMQAWAWAAAALAAGAAAAQEEPDTPRPEAPSPPGRFFFDPQPFFQQWFHGAAPVDEAALAEIPVTAREEQAFGRRAADAYLDALKGQQISVAGRGREVDYLRRLVAMLVPEMGHRERYRDIRVFLADTETTDAHCFPGGTLLLDRGLLEFLGSEAALVGVLAHELSHVDHGHQLRALRRVKLAEQTFSGSGAKSPAQFFRNGTLLLQTFLQPCRPEDELQADRDAVAWSYALDYDPRELATLFLEMHRRGAGPPEFLPGFLRSHPDFQSRYDAALATYESLQARRPKPRLYIGRENLRQRIPREERAFPD